MPKVDWKTGVYGIFNRVSGKVYVGSAAVAFTQRFKNHRILLRGNRHHSIHLQHAWNKYGATNFIFKILERCSPTKCIEWEQYWIDFYESANCEYGYNRSPKAGSCLGTKHGTEARENMRQARLKTPMTASHKAAMAEGVREAYENPKLLEKVARINAERIAAETTEERRYRMRGWHNQVYTPERRAHMSKTMTGKKRSEETRQKISQAQIGKKLSEETKSRISASLKGRVVSQEAIDKMVATKIVRCRTPEFRSKMSIAAKEGHRKRRERAKIL